ncbi:fat-like cadherin-related tumor suppressor homolog, partial [Phlebotomus argentipes]|uniref:fat-like cadherin-related tumor suppressor homolog n=1 Tax=Phlebotomus argentipes TaxID=94469 RepID=UPI0028936EBB
PTQDGIQLFKFTHALYNVSIPENSAGRTFVQQPTDEARMGVHWMPGHEVKYRIVGGDKEKVFKVEERIVGDFAFLTVRTRTGNVVLNREKTDEYNLDVRVTVTQRRSATKAIYEDDTRVHIRVLDTNDLNPLFYPTEYSATVPEDCALHRSIVRVVAEDADLGINGEIYYSLLEPLATEQFAVHPTSGVLSLTRPLNFAERSFHELIVIATDRGGGVTTRATATHASKARVHIKVKQVNLYPPTIYTQALPEIVEDSNAHIFGIVRVEDMDKGIHGRIKSLDIVDGDPNGHFRIRPTKRHGEYNIEVHQLLDREATPQGYNLTLRAVDWGIPPRQSYKVVPVHLADANDNVPVFSREIYEVSVPESSPPNTPIIRLKVSDRDVGKNAQVFLEIVGGNEGGEFRVNPDTGMLYTAVPLDTETKSFYTLTVSAIDQGNSGTRKQSSAKVKINVADINDNDPVFEGTNSTIFVDENEPAGTTVTKVTAKDRDAGENAYISYSIANLNDVPFDIDHFSGVVRTSKLIDYESMRRQYVLRVRASDWGLPYRRQTEMQLHIRIRDVNDNRPQFEKVECSVEVLRSAPLGAEIFTLSAIDFDAGNMISYRMVAGNEDGCFNLDMSSGVISVGCDLTEIVAQRREINVTATDGTHFADVTRVHINIVHMRRSSTGAECRETGVTRRQAEILAESERNNMPRTDVSHSEEFVVMPSRYGENIHSPEFVDFPFEVRVNETAALGTTVAVIRARDRDLGYNGKLVFGISDGDNDSVFRLDPDTGELKIIGYLDREREDEYVLNVTVYDLGKPQKSVSKVLPVTVLDENDNAPKFEKSLTSFRIPENALNGTIVIALNATDADAGENGKVRYGLVTETKDFRVDPEAGVVTVSGTLDRERQEVYELRVRATDGAERGASLHTDAIVRITVEDINDNAPVFSVPEGYTVRVREDVPWGTLVVVVTATDADVGASGEVGYKLLLDEESDEVPPFRIDEFSGAMRTTGSLDFEERQIHTLTVRAFDRGHPSLAADTTVTVEIVDVNENRQAPQFEDFVLTGRVKENQPLGTHVMIVRARDADPPGPDSRITYSVRSGDGLGLFTVDAEGNIRTMAVFDVESKSHYWLTICAQDHGVVPLHTCTEAFIEIENENDNVPLTDEVVYYASVAEGSSSGLKIVQLHATDRDVDPMNRITYRIVAGNPEGFFTINSTNGVISTTGRKLDRENQSEHILEIMVQDNGSPELSSTTRVVITVDDINDHSPEFDQKFYKVQIPATAKVEQKLFQVLAIDRDTGDNGRVSYAIKSGKGKAKFRMDQETGIVYAAKSLDVDTEFDLLVRAEDAGVPKRAQTTRVSVLVVDVPVESQHAPHVKHTEQHVEITESDQPGFLVTLVQAADEDDDILWYDIVSGDDRNEFFIGRDNGNVLLVKKLDWEQQREYNLTISVTDGVHVTHAFLYVTVLDINDHRPEFSQSVYRVNVSESVEDGTEILQLQATDADADKKLFYSLHAAQDPSSLKMFRVDAVTGGVFLTQKLDREMLKEHVLVVIVRDRGTPAKKNYARVEITVMDYNDHAPEFTTRIVQGKVFETASIGSMVVQLYATDRDQGDNAKITYSIVSGNIGSVFTVDGQMGVIAVAKELDMNSVAEYMLQVKASDGGQPSLSTQIPVHIMVHMADNAPPKFTRHDLAAEIYENQPMGTFVGQVEARSTSSVVYEIVEGNANDTFFVNPSTGVVTTNSGVDYEQQRFYNLTIEATNMASVATRCSLIVHVLDRNDNAPHFERHLYMGSISEAASIGSLVLVSLANGTANTTMVENSEPLVIRAVDADSGVNAFLHYDIVEALPRRFFHIDSTTGAIKTVMVLDHEKIPAFTFHVKVSDLGVPRLSSETTARVEIAVTDVNDCTPVFVQKEYNVTLLLPTYTNIAVVQVQATDRDTVADAPQLTYEIIEGNKGDVFSINATSGVITTRDVEQIVSQYRLKVRVSDGKFSKTALVHVQVETSENSGLIFQRAFYEGSIVENSTKIATVTVVNVLGTILNEHIEFRILNPTDMFRIGMTSGVVETTGVRFDREVRDKYELIVEARSQTLERERPRVAHVVVNVTVLDVNDNCPMFVNLPYYAVVSVDDPKGSVITKVHALDLDSQENGEVRYEMKRGHGELFKVDRKTGEVTLKQTLEGHNRDYELLIAAYDGGITPCFTDVTVHVKVIDKSMPVFSKQFYSDSVAENVELYTPLSVSIQAESPLGRKLIYTIVKGNELEEFALDFNTGAIYVVDELDFEQRQSYELTIRATDSVSGASAEVPASILVTDVNDCPPEMDQDVYNVTVSEGAPFGTAILRVSATDRDTGVNQAVMFAIETDSKNTSEFFHMDATEGVVYLKKSLDFEALRVHHFVVIAMDKGVPSLSSTSHVWINVADMNDNPPRFEQSSYSCSLSEHASRGQFVTSVTASDPDHVDHTSLIYTIAQGNDQQTYTIDPDCGTISLVNMQNFAEKQLTVLNVSVTDGVYTSFTRVKVNILPGNLHSPSFHHLVHDVKVNENQLAGRLVARVVAQDEDFGEYGQLTYSLLSDELAESFALDHAKGEIVTKVRLDREAREIYEMVVMASDGGGRVGFTTVRVHVADENDNAPLFHFHEYTASIHGNHTIGSPFLRVRATDLDENQNAAIHYSLYDAQNTGVKDLFGVNENSGELFLKRTAHEFENQLFQFFIRAFDGGVPSMHNDVPVNVYVMAPSDVAPMFEKKEKSLFLSETATPGTLISRFRLVDNLTHSFRIVSGDKDDPHFAINEAGELRLARSLDREEKEVHAIGILAETDSSPPLTALTEIQLHVQDDNDHAPVFESNPYVVTVAENSEKGSTILKVTATDRDSGSNGDVRYYLASDNTEAANTFGIDPYTGWIATLAELDKEVRGEFKFRVIATDNGNVKLNDSTLVVIKLKDYNDNPPIFTQDHYNSSVSEDALPGTVVLQLSVTDLDVDLVTPIEYYIFSGDKMSQFQIRRTGELYVAKALDRETIDFYNLTVLVTDGKFTATANVSITILDVNDNPPYCLKFRYKKTVAEDVAPSTQLLIIEASDADLESNSKLRYFLTGRGADDLSLDKDSGVLKIARQLDRETISRYILVAHVQDRDHFGWECSSQVEITVSDVNDNAPSFSLAIYTVSLPEDAEIETLVTKVHATDVDVGVNRKIRYSILDEGKEKFFRIASDSGIITLASGLDREMQEVHNVTVKATDQGVPELFSTALVIINIQDINDNPPEFTTKYFTAAIPEDTVLGAEVIEIVATSRDVGINAEISYSFIGGNEQKRFRVDNRTGIVSVVGELDYERARDYFLTIQAMDGGEPPLSSLATLNITITDSNDNPPQFTQTSYTARIREDALVGDKIIQVKAVDLDSDDNGKVVYAIEKGDRLKQFAIEPETGYISVASALDRESISNYVLEIRAADLGIPSLTSYVLVNVEISDANDNPPLFSELNYTAYIHEDKTLGHVLLRFNITDADAEPNTVPYTFDFRSGNEGGVFRLEQDGILRTAARFNHKVRNKYDLEIRVFDNGTPPLFSDTHVTVNVIEESQYPPIITPLEVAINSFKESYPGGEIGRVHATDQDQYDSLVYGLAPTLGVSYTPTSLFNISAEGVLYALPDLDLGDYRINVTVSDGKFIAATIVKVSVDLVTEEMLSNAVVLRFRKVKPSDFLLSHRKGFIRSIRNAIGCRIKDVMIISVQSASIEADDVNVISREKNLRTRREVNEDLDVLFTVRRFPLIVGASTFYSVDEITKVMEDNLEEIEDITRLTIEEIVKSTCSPGFCHNGKCEVSIRATEDATSSAISIDISSFVAPHYRQVIECRCRVGFGGDRCENRVNECASNLCPSHKVCIPDASSQGYHCACPEGFAGPNCARDVSKCEEESCYSTVNPVSFSGKSYAQYKVERLTAKTSVENQLMLSLQVRTVQLTGCLMFAAGRVDYNILEVSGGFVQYRFDLGSGEGLVSVASVFIADGQWHEIRVEREGNSVRVLVDKSHVASGSAPGVNGVLNLQTNDVYFGAEVRQHATVLGFEDIEKGFIGCLDDIRLSRQSLPLHLNTNDEGSILTLRRFANVEYSCDATTVLKPLGICGSQPCLNGGTCREFDGTFECLCHARFSGPLCGSDRDPCASSPCLYGGQCRDHGSGNYTCNCPPKMTGKRCDFGRFCAPNPCRNGGVCEEGDFGPLCMCRGYMGPTCEVDVNECENQPCGSGATCINEAGSFRCICPPYLTGASCGDPLYSNLLKSMKLDNIPFEVILIGGGVFGVIVLFAIVGLIWCMAARKRKNHQAHNNTNNVLKNDPLAVGYKRGSKMSNLEQQQAPRPVSYTPTSNPDAPYVCSFMNNLETLRNYGSAGDELENVVEEYRKQRPTQPLLVNINAAGGDADAGKQWDQIHLQTFSDGTSPTGKINNDVKMLDPHMRLGTLKTTGILPGRLVTSPPEEQQGHGAYHWDCSDWVPRSHNPLPNITEVPGSEIPDSSSFHSNESNESQPKMVPQMTCVVDPARDIETLNEDLESDVVTDYGNGEEDPMASLTALNPLDSGSEDYRFSTVPLTINPKAESYLRHPNSYLPRYNIQSDTDGERASLMANGGAPSVSIVESDEEAAEEDSIPSYGFPVSVKARRRNRLEARDMEMAMRGQEDTLLHRGSNSDLSVHLCEIEDSEYEGESSALAKIMQQTSV